MQSAKMITKIHTIHLACSGLLIAMGVILPQYFHMFGQNAGMIFLPIQIPILIAGLLLGPFYGATVGILVPIVSFLLMGMPPIPMLYFMLFELGTYGIVTGIAAKKFSCLISLLIGMIAGRMIYGLSLVAGVLLWGFRGSFATVSAFGSGLLTGIPGIVIQLITIPLLCRILRRGRFSDEEFAE